MAERRTRRRFTAEFKAQAVKRLLESGKGLSETATELGLSPGQLSLWRNEHLAAGSAEALATRKVEQAEVQRLKRENKRLEEEVEILKKAAAFFARGIACGPAPWEWRGGIRTSCGFGHGDPFHAGPHLQGSAIAQGRVQALPVVEDLDVIEHGRLGFLTRAEAGVVDLFRLERGEEALHGGVVEAIPPPAHRLRDPMPLQNLTVG